MSIAEAFQRYMQESGENQETIAARMKVSQSTVSRWVSGAATPARKHVPRLAELLGMTTHAVGALLVEPTMGERLETLERQMAEILERLERRG